MPNQGGRCSSSTSSGRFAKKREKSAINPNACACSQWNLLGGKKGSSRCLLLLSMEFIWREMRFFIILFFFFTFTDKANRPALVVKHHWPGCRNSKWQQLPPAKQMPADPPIMSRLTVLPAAILIVASNVNTATCAHFYNYIITKFKLTTASKHSSSWFYYLINVAYFTNIYNNVSSDSLRVSWWISGTTKFSKHC